MKLAVFDVCGTLYSSNTTFDFLDWYFSKDKKYQFFRKLSKTFLGKLLNYPFYKFMKKDLIRLIGTSFLKNKSIIEIEIASKKFVKERLYSKNKLDIIKLLENYKKKKYVIVLVSGSYEFLIKEIALEFEVNNFFATKLQNKNDSYTGKIGNDQLFNKLVLIKTIYPKYQDLIVVSDNLTDYSLLKAASKGFIVCNKRKHINFWKEKNLKNCVLINHYE